MKKRAYIMMAVFVAVCISGCSGKDAEKQAVVRELPIGQDAGEEIPEGSEPLTETVSTNAGAGVDEEVAEELAKESYEDIQVEVNGNKGTILVGTTGAPFTELLTQAKILLAKDGWDLQIKRYDEYEKLSEDVVNGNLDAHLFAHQTYVDSYNDVNGTSLSVVNGIVYEVYGVYSKTNPDLTNINGATIAIPADVPGKGRALLFMQDMGWITLKEKAGVTAIVEDVVENPKNLQFIEYEREALGQVFNEADYGIIGADVAIAAGFDMEEDVLQKEKSSYESVSAFSSLLIATEENVQNEKMKVLSKALNSKEVKSYVEETYEGAYAFVN